jgi:hypothetical protein
MIDKARVDSIRYLHAAGVIDPDNDIPDLLAYIDQLETELAAVKGVLKSASKDHFRELETIKRLESELTRAREANERIRLANGRLESELAAVKACPSCGKPRSAICLDCCKEILP